MSGESDVGEPRRRRGVVALVTLTFAFLATRSEIVPGVERKGPLKAHDPAWTLALREHEYQVDEYDSCRKGEEEDTAIAFGSNTELVVLDHIVTDPAAKTHEVNVRAFVIDTSSGTVMRTRNWARKNSGSTVFATAGGRYAVLDKGTVLYGPGLEDELARSPHAVEMISPSGGRFAAPTSPVKEEEWITMDPETLAETGEIRSFYRNRTSLADRSIARLVLGPTPFIEIATIDRSPVRYQPRQDASPHFVSEDMLIVVSENRSDVITIDGALLFSVAGGWDAGTHVSASRGGRRMAVTQERYDGHWNRLKSERITVYDLQARAPIWTVEHKAMKGAFSGHSGIALSPDGTLLAILSRGIVTLHKLPGAATVGITMRPHRMEAPLPAGGRGGQGSLRPHARRARGAEREHGSVPPPLSRLLQSDQIDARARRRRAPALG